MTTNGHVSLRDALRQHSGIRRYLFVPASDEFPAHMIQSLFDGEHKKLVNRQLAEDQKTYDETYIFADWVIATVVDVEEGEPEFGEMDREWLAAVDVSVAEPILRRIVEHCRKGGGSTSLEDAKKNSSTTTNATCFTGSPTAGGSPA